MMRLGFFTVLVLVAPSAVLGCFPYPYFTTTTLVSPGLDAGYIFTWLEEAVTPPAIKITTGIPQTWANVTHIHITLCDKDNLCTVQGEAKFQNRPVTFEFSSSEVQQALTVPEPANENYAYVEVGANGQTLRQAIPKVELVNAEGRPTHAAHLFTDTGESFGDALFWLRSNGDLSYRVVQSLYRPVEVFFGAAEFGAVGVPFPGTVVVPLTAQSIAGTMDSLQTTTPSGRHYLDQHMAYVQVTTTDTAPTVTMRGHVYPTGGVPIIPSLDGKDGSGTIATQKVNIKLCSNERGRGNTQFTIGLKAESPAMFGDQLVVTFPNTGFSFGTPQVTSVVGLVNGPDTVIARGNTLSMRWATNETHPYPAFHSGAGAFNIRLTVSDLTLPNNCNQDPVSVQTFSCPLTTVLRGDTSPVQVPRCKPSPQLSLSQVIPTAIPNNCGLCNSCKFYGTVGNGQNEWSSYSADIYRCDYNDKTFTRVGNMPKCGSANNLDDPTITWCEDGGHHYTRVPIDSPCKA